MKLKDSEKSLIFILIGIAAVVLGFIYVVKPNYQAMQAAQQESVQLRSRLSELQQKQAKRDEYLAGIDEFENAYNDVIAKFPADLNQEVTIMFLQGIKDNNEFDISALTLGEKELFYTLGTNQSDGTLTNVTDSSASTSTASTSTESSTTESSTTEASTGSTGTELSAESTTNNAYTCYRADFPITYSGSYESLKDVVKYIDGFGSRMTVNALDIAYEPDTDVYSGNLDLKCYAIEGEDRPQSNLELNEVETGSDNIFKKGSEGGSSSSGSKGLNKYDENDGASIEHTYDFYTMLNPATSDVSAKVVGQNGSGKEASVVSNSENSVSTLSYEFYEQDGKNYCKYDLDGTSYTAEVTSAEDIKLLIQSSTRKDAQDKAGVRITIKNSTKLPVYVKVSGDDASSPRVNIASKSGSVKVY